MILDLDKIIKNASDSGDIDKVNLCTTLKEKISEFKETNKGVPYDERVEVNIIKAMKSELNESYVSTILDEFIPEVPTEKDLKNFLSLWMERTPGCKFGHRYDLAYGEISYYRVPKKIIGAAVKALAMEFPSADIEVITDLVVSTSF